MAVVKGATSEKRPEFTAGTVHSSIKSLSQAPSLSPHLYHRRRFETTPTIVDGAGISGRIASLVLNVFGYQVLVALDNLICVLIFLPGTLEGHDHRRN